MDCMAWVPGRWLLRGEKGVGWEWWGGELELEEGGGGCCVVWLLLLLLLLLVLVDGFWSRGRGEGEEEVGGGVLRGYARG